MLWPDRARTRLVAGDHGDIVGHYRLRPSITTDPSGRRYSSYDLLESGTGFTDETFARVWNAVFDFCEGSIPRGPANPATTSGRR